MIVTDSNFDEVINAHDVVLVDFWAEWCSPCRRFSPILDEIAQENNVWIGKIDADENTISADKYNVISLPTVIVFKGGQEVKRTKGAMPKHKFLRGDFRMDLADDHLEFEIWLANGYDRGWISDVFCDTHEGPPMTEEEMQEWDGGGDPCSFHVKVIELH